MYRCRCDVLDAAEVIIRINYRATFLAIVFRLEKACIGGVKQ